MRRNVFWRMRTLTTFFIVCFSLWCYSVESQRVRNVYNASEYCNSTTARDLSSYNTVEEFDRCAPSLLPVYAREYFTAAATRRYTYRENLMAYRRLRIHPKVLRDVSNLNTEVTVLGDTIKIPIGASPTALQKLASDRGEIDTITATYDAGTVMVLSSYGSTSIEDVARAAPKAIKWMQTYLFPQREITLDIVRRAEKFGYRALVVTVDSPTEASIPSRFTVVPNPKGVTYANPKLRGDTEAANPKLTFLDLAWLKKQTRLPIIAKGILTPADAVRAAQYGASAIFVSNHGGRQLDFEPATIDVLPSIVDALHNCCPRVEVFIDGGVRNGFDVFKALAYGARAVFIGRPVLWGLTVGGKNGVSRMFEILTREMNETMMLAGTPDVNSIERKMVRDHAAYVPMDDLDFQPNDI